MTAMSHLGSHGNIVPIGWVEPEPPLAVLHQRRPEFAGDRPQLGAKGDEGDLQTKPTMSTAPITN